MNALTDGAAVSWLRLSRRSSWWALGCALAFVTLVTLLERQESGNAADMSLTGVSFGIVLPLLAFGIVRQACNGARLDRSFAELATFGANRRHLALGQALVTVVAATSLGSVLGGMTVLLARHMNDAALLRDLGASASVGALAGAGYACWFTLGSRLGRQGGGRTAFLLLDWLLGSSSSALALPLPRGHVRNLLGAAPVMDLSQASAAVLLAALTFFALSLAIWSIPR